MICHRCSALLPHDLAHVREHAALCDGNSVEEFISKFASLADSIANMVRAGNISICLHEPNEDHIRCRECDALLA